MKTVSGTMRSRPSRGAITLRDRPAADRGGPLLRFPMNRDGGMTMMDESAAQGSVTEERTETTRTV